MGGLTPDADNGREAPVPRYFFHIHDGRETIPDTFGLELPDEAAVGKTTVEGARDLMAEAIRRGEDISRSWFDVTDEAGHRVLKFPFSAAIRKTDT